MEQSIEVNHIKKNFYTGMLQLLQKMGSKSNQTLQKKNFQTENLSQNDEQAQLFMNHCKNYNLCNSSLNQLITKSENPIKEQIQQEEQDSVEENKQKKYYQIGSCNCSKSNCLRFYCGCFKSQGFCNSNCNCINCLNQEKNKFEREFVIKQSKRIQQGCFSKKVEVFEGQNIFVHGCKCKKGCVQNFCECKKTQSKCTPICQCEGCNNEKLDLDRQTIRKLYKVKKRKKDKLIINYQNRKSSNKKATIKLRMYKSDKLIEFSK